MKIKLDKVIEAMEFANEECRFVYSTNDEKVLFLFDGMVNGEDDEELYEEITEGLSDEYIYLPDQYDIHEYRMMEMFVYAIDDERNQIELYNAIKGRGAFRRFKDAIHRLGIQDDWYKFRDDEYKKIALEWCETNNFEVIE